MDKHINLFIIVIIIIIPFPGCTSKNEKNSEEYPIHLYVSNQSSKDPSANITILVDGEIVFKEQCWVDDSHNWTLVEFNLTSGIHIFKALESDNNMSKTWSSNIRGERWIVIDYWYKHQSWGSFTFDVDDVVPCFG
ncbi:MAG: hypothetical protein JSW00_13060 [Thermoplasmata archaeon]|nr:MAG: hypothetical protein JSW00_13060 [Thermoplasmata archaeon]